MILLNGKYIKWCEIVMYITRIDLCNHERNTKRQITNNNSVEITFMFKIAQSILRTQ